MATVTRKIEIGKDKLVLVLEDNASIRESLVKDLREIGMKAEILEAEDLGQAKSMFENNKLDFIISDWNLPDGTGLDFLKLIRKKSKIPFIMCTTVDEVGNILEAVSEGSDEFITKPWTIEELDEKVYSTWSKYYPN